MLVIKETEKTWRVDQNLNSGQQDLMGSDRPRK